MEYDTLIRHGLPMVGVVLSQNQPGPHSPRPYPVHLAQAFAFFGL
jgi:hypothetical protein